MYTSTRNYNLILMLQKTCAHLENIYYIYQRYLLPYDKMEPIHKTYNHDDSHFLLFLLAKASLTPFKVCYCLFLTTKSVINYLQRQRLSCISMLCTIQEANNFLKDYKHDYTNVKEFKNTQVNRFKAVHFIIFLFQKVLFTLKYSTLFQYSNLA